jgi:hypothetical protein
MTFALRATFSERDMAEMRGENKAPADGFLRGIERRSYIPRPPSREDVERISEAQGLITDEWVGDGPIPESKTAGRR